MNLISLNCPNCDSFLYVEEGRSMTFCQYCGGQIYIDGGVKRSEHTHTYTRTYRKIDVARYQEAVSKQEIRRLELAHDERQKKVTLIVLVITIIFFIGLMVYADISWKNKNEEWEREEREYERQRSEKLEQGYICAGDNDDYEGKNYEAVRDQLKAMGFMRIKTVDLNDAGIFSNPENTVESISIGGETSFDSEDLFEPDAKIIITYH